MSEHTPEPWAVDEEDALIRTNRNGSGEQDYICMLADQSNDFGESWDTMEFCGSNRNGEIKANARRIVACVNACTGLPIEALEESATLPGGFGTMAAEYLDRLKKAEAEIAKLRAEREELQRRVDTYERAWLAENGRACNLFDKVGTLSQLLERHLADNADGERNRCNCQLCIDTRAALAEKGE